MPVELDIAGNFAKGQGATIQRRHSRQLEQAIDLELANASDKNTSRRNIYERYMTENGMQPSAAFQGLQDPFAFRLMDWWKQRRAQKKAAENSALQPELMGPPEPDAGMMGPPEPEGALAFADGGMPSRLVEESRRQAGIEKQRLAAQRGTSMTSRAGGMARSAVNSRVGRGAGAIAGLSAIAPQMDEDYDTRMEERFGFAPPSPEDGDPSLGGFAKYFGKRALGYASDLGDALTFGAAGNHYRDNEGQGDGLDILITHGAEPPPDQAAAAAAEQAKDPPPRAALPDVQQQVAQKSEEQFDWNTVDAMPDELPNMNVRDWVDYRKKTVGDLLLAGMNETEANDQVTALQQKGFLTTGQQALALMQSGNMPAAARALKAAYQYFPNGADVSFGIQGDHLIGMGKSEETGERTGKPMILNEERLAALLTNFENPKNFLAWTKDWRDEAFRERGYQEVTRPAAQANARAGQTNAQANLLDAQSNAAYRSSGAGRGADPGPDDRARSEGVFRQELEMMALDDPEAYRKLTSVMSQVRARYPDTRQLPDNELMELVMKAHASGQLDGIAQQFGLR